MLTNTYAVRPAAKTQLSVKQLTLCLFYKSCRFLGSKEGFLLNLTLKHMFMCCVQAQRHRHKFSSRWKQSGKNVRNLPPVSLLGCQPLHCETVALIKTALSVSVKRFHCKFNPSNISVQEKEAQFQQDLSVLLHDKQMLL